MGWFDNEQEGERPKAAPAPAPPRPEPVKSAAPPAPSKAPETGSTLGRQIQVDGTIVCGEDLTILGKVDGTIRAKGTLVIAKDADVRARIDGDRVVVHGKVDGDVRGADRVVLGQTGRLTGNVAAPTLEIVEGAYFKGTVDMKGAAASAPQPADSAKDKVAAPAKAVDKSASSAGKDSSERKPSKDSSQGKKASAGTGPAAPPGKPVATADGAAASKQATS